MIAALLTKRSNPSNVFALYVLKSIDANICTRRRSIATAVRKNVEAPTRTDFDIFEVLKDNQYHFKILVKD